MNVDTVPLHEDEEYKRGSTAIALTYRGGIYLSRRIGPQKKPEFYGKWQCPGGKVDPGENPLDAVIREVREETGIVLVPVRISFVTYVRNDPTTSCCYFYTVELREDEIPKRLEPEKATKWWRIDFDLAKQFDLMPGIASVIRFLENYSEPLEKPQPKQETMQETIRRIATEKFENVLDSARKNR